MKIVYITHCLQIGGAELLVVNYLIKLKQMGHDVCLIQLWNVNSFLKAKLDSANIQIYTLSVNTKFKIFNKVINKFFSIIKKQSWEQKINSLIPKIKPDVIHIHTLDLHLDKINFDNIFFTFHTDVDRSIKYAKPWFYSSMENSVENGIKILTLSEKIKEQVLNFFPTANVLAISNGIDVNDISSKKIDRDAFLSSIGISNDAFILGHVGRFHPVKNHEKIIKVFSEVLKRNPNSYLLLVGGYSKQRIKTLEILGNEIGVIEKIKFLGERADATAIMSIFDCFILPSHREGFSLVLCEAQVHNVRSIATSEVPDDVIINDNCFKLDINESDEKWADYVLGNFTESHHRTLDSVDINLIVKKHVLMYEEGVHS